MICLMLTRFGNDGSILNFGNYHFKFLGIGTVVGYAIIVPAILCTYLIGANLTILVSYSNTFGKNYFSITQLFFQIGIVHQFCWWYFVYHNWS